MAKPDLQSILDAIGQTRDRESFLQGLLRSALNWPIPETLTDPEEISYCWTIEELRAQGLEKSIVDGRIFQLQPLYYDQPWGIFLLEFENAEALVSTRGIAGPLRKVLRGLVPSRRRESDLPAWKRENLLFICTSGYEHFRFAYFKSPQEPGATAPLASFGWSRDDTHIRTLCEHNLPLLVWPQDLKPESWTAQWTKAFDVETVTRNFFREIANWYFWARDCREVVLPKDVKTEEDRALFLIRLLARLIFCWFLRRKRNPQTGEGLLPDDLFEEQHICEILKDASPEAGSYYTAVLQNLFFATLNTEMDRPGELPRRRFIDEGDGRYNDDHMIHTLWRNAGLLRDPDGFSKLLRRVPFLNGGLFECLDDRVQQGSTTVEVRLDGFSNLPHKHPKLPNFLFFGHEQNVDLSTAYGDSNRRLEIVRPLLSVLRSYNFTLSENTPLELEVALDPELLGHVFENLLAAYNPETGMVARKATGSFYTPRIVVDWMVDQALLVYLDKALIKTKRTPISEQPDSRLRQLLSWDDTAPNFNPFEADVLIDAIDSLKVLDPACGSGAFPMGMLQKLVHVLRKLDPRNDGWRSRQVAAVDAIESSPARDQARQAIARAFAHDNDDYGRKLYLIENCLYGVDVQPIACQIAKLRFFIALIVDQTVDPSEHNYGILPLPNLETKIVAANTLLGFHRNKFYLATDRVRCLEQQLLQIRHDYFTVRSYKDKKTLRDRDKEVCKTLIAALNEGGGFTQHDTKRIAEWNPYDTNTSATFFDPAWMFGLSSQTDLEAGSFDIVIGNPPYVRQEQLRNETAIGINGLEHPLKDVLKELYECYTGTADLYVYFFERSFQLLRVGGVLSFITSNKYMRAAYGERLRIYVAYASYPIAVLDFGDAPLFTSIAYPCILVAEKTRHVGIGELPSLVGSSDPEHLAYLLHAPDRKMLVYSWIPGKSLSDFPSTFETEAHSLALRDLKPDGWRLEGPAGLRLLERLRLTGINLVDYVQGRLYRGIVTGHNDAFVVPRAIRDDLIAEHESSAEVLRPFLRGRDVKRWRVKPQDQWLLFIPWHFPLHEDHSIKGASREAEEAFRQRYPAVYRHLSTHKPELVSRNKAETGVRYEWYALQRWGADYWREFEQPKVIVPAIEDEVSYAPDYLGYCGNDKTSIIIPPSVPFALAILNSPVSWWITRMTFASKQGGYYEFKPMYFSQLPIPSATMEQQALCERLAQALIWLFGQEASQKTDTAPMALMKAYFEQWLNGLVYELYFPGELHDRKLNLFDETQALNPSLLAAVNALPDLSNLVEIFEMAYDTNSSLRSMLFSLHSLESVRVIEEPLGSEVAASSDVEP